MSAHDFLNPKQFGEYMGHPGVLADATVRAHFGGGFRDDYSYDPNSTEPASVEWAAKEARKHGADGVN